LTSHNVTDILNDNSNYPKRTTSQKSMLLISTMLIPDSQT